MEEEDLKKIHCPRCGSYKLEHWWNTEKDSEGEFENHVVLCTVCNFRTLAMDSLQDAVDAFLDPEEDNIAEDSDVQF